MSQNGNSGKGLLAETVACGYLEGLGYEIIERRYRCSFGEIDIIAGDGEYLVFVEVKYRKSLKAGFPAEAVTKTKQRAIVKTAFHYILKRKPGRENYRFDVIEVFGAELIDVNHHINAFYAE